MKNLTQIFMLCMFLFLTACSVSVTEKSSDMPMFVIERAIPGAGKLSSADLKKTSENSCSVLADLGKDIKWSHSYVTNDKIYCVYYAANEELIKQHASKLGIPANLISQVGTIISPATAN